MLYASPVKFEFRPIHIIYCNIVIVYSKAIQILQERHKTYFV